MKQKREYFAMSDEGLRNGSFIRKSVNGLGQFMNGDFMGFIPAVPEGFSKVEQEYAEKLIPKCCR